MKNYIVYDRNSNILRRFDTLEEGKDYVHKLAQEWLSIGRKCPLYRVCYNGTRSEELYRCGE